jgi:DNA-binding beta-propeller fold protein YncE
VGRLAVAAMMQLVAVLCVGVPSDAVAAVMCVGGVVERAVVTTLAGSGSSSFSDGSGTNADFNNPRGVAVDASGNVYVADYNNHRIRKVTAGGGTWIGPATLFSRVANSHIDAALL